LRADHWFHVANFIQAKLDLLDTQKAQEEDEGEQNGTEAKKKSPTSPISCGNIYLGAAQHATPIRSILERHNQEPVFRNFSELISFLSSELGQVNARKAELSTEVCTMVHMFLFHGFLNLSVTGD
jgi:hypothetical protein